MGNIIAPYSAKKPVAVLYIDEDEKIDYSNLKPVSNHYDSDLIVLLDIDETMVYSQTFNSKKEADNYAKRNSSLDYCQVYCSSKVMHINLRPGLKQFVEKIATTFETHIFTASTSTYAKLVAQLLDPEGIHFKKIWSQEHCQKKGDGFVKHLSKLPLGRSDQRRVVLLDDNVDNLVASMGNVMLIKKFQDNPKDKELIKAQEFLLNKLKDRGTDVQPILEAKATKENAIEIWYYQMFIDDHQ